MDIKVMKAIKSSIKHHQRNVEKLKKARGKFIYERNEFHIGRYRIHYCGSYCALCNALHCRDCPLNKHQGGRCNGHHKFMAWGKIFNATNQKQALKAEQNMVKVLEEVLGLYKADKL